MSISDELMWRYIDLLSFKSSQDIQLLKNSVQQGLNPRDVKIDFAKEIVSRFHNALQAEKAHKEFLERFQQGVIPENLQELLISSSSPILLVQLLKQIGFTASTSESMRLVKQAAVKVNEEKVSDPALSLALEQTYIIQVGKRRIAKVLLKKMD
jgi:tyrosyl-tRNA synthetase